MKRYLAMEQHLLPRLLGWSPIGDSSVYHLLLSLNNLSSIPELAKQNDNGSNPFAITFAAHLGLAALQRKPFRTRIIDKLLSIRGPASQVIGDFHSSLVLCQRKLLSPPVHILAIISFVWIITAPPTLMHTHIIHPLT